MTSLLLISWLLFQGTGIHAFHASILEMEYREDRGAVQVSYRMFSDDLEMALSEWSSTKLNILDPGQKVKIDELLVGYLSDKLKIWVNGDEINYEYLGSELEDGALWCYLEKTDIPKLETIEVDNSVMLELFEDQINLVHFSKKDKVRSLKLYFEHTYGILKLADLYAP